MGLYFGEEIKNVSGSTKKYTWTFQSKYTVISHKSNPITITLKNGETGYISAKQSAYQFDWGLYSLKTESA